MNDLMLVVDQANEKGETMLQKAATNGSPPRGGASPGEKLRVNPYFSSRSANMSQHPRTARFVLRIRNDGSTMLVLGSAFEEILKPV